MSISAWLPYAGRVSKSADRNIATFSVPIKIDRAYENVRFAFLLDSLDEMKQIPKRISDILVTGDTYAIWVLDNGVRVLKGWTIRGREDIHGQWNVRNICDADHTEDNVFVIVWDDEICLQDRVRWYIFLQGIRGINHQILLPFNKDDTTLTALEKTFWRHVDTASVSCTGAVFPDGSVTVHKRELSGVRLQDCGSVLKLSMPNDNDWKINLDITLSGKGTVALKALYFDGVIFTKPTNVKTVSNQGFTAMSSCY